MEDGEEDLVKKFRNGITTWKKTVLFTGLNNEGDDESINRRLEEAHTLFFQLMDYINSTEQQAPQEIESLVRPLGEKSNWSESLLDQVRDIVFTDLYEYPFTFNESLIEQFKTDEDEDFPTFE
jgi:hypothetical protein